MDIDGQQQRKALTAVENALRALGDGDPFRAKRNAFLAEELDQIDLYTSLPGAVAMAIRDIEYEGKVTREGWDRLGEVVGPGPLQALIAELRGPDGG